MAPPTFGENLVIWEALALNLQPLLAEMPHIVEDQAELAALAMEGRALEGQQDTHKQQLRDTNERRRAVQVRCKKLRDKLVAALQNKFGPDSLLLLGYGIEPRKPPRRGRQSPSELKAKKAGAPAPPTPPVPTTPQE